MPKEGEERERERETSAVMAGSKDMVTGGHSDLDLDSLSRYISKKLANTAWYPATDDHSVFWSANKYQNGQSNPTYLVRCQDGKTGRDLGRWVLRRQPFGILLPSAHAVDREYMFQLALGTKQVPVPRVLALCEDNKVIGSSFYLMEVVDGPIYKDPRLPQCDAERRTRVYRELARALAGLHSVDASRLDGIPRGRAKTRKAGGASYGLRTLRRWRKQYLASCRAVREEPLENMMFLAEHLERTAPEGRAAKRECVLHGDFRLDNLVCDPHTDEVRAILDWELATVGTADQGLADVAYCCLAYYLPPTVLAIQTLTKFSDETGGIALDVPEGVPSIRDFLACYLSHRKDCDSSMVAEGADELVRSPRWRWFVQLALFRVAAILAGVGSRAKAGNASAANAGLVGSVGVVSGVIDTAIDLIEVSDCREGSSKFEVLKHKCRVFCARVGRIEPELVKRASTDQRWSPHPSIDKLKSLAKRTGLWNAFLTPDLCELARSALEKAGVRMDEQQWSRLLGPMLSNRQYAELAEMMGRYPHAPEVFNCSAPDTGNMEVLARHGTPEQCKRWLLPLLEGDIRSCFAMTEPDVASSDATNVASTVSWEGDRVLVSGKKWWITGAMHPKCEVCLFLGREASSSPQGARSSPKGAQHGNHTIVVLPMKSQGLRVVRPLDVFGTQDPPHGHAEVHFDSVAVPAKGSVIFGRGRGFEVAQSRLGPGRLHHCARAIGVAERALEMAFARAASRVAFGAPIARKGGFLRDLALRRTELDQSRLLVHAAAEMLDEEEAKRGGAPPTRSRRVRMCLAQAKVVVPRACLAAVDFAMQVHGAAGVSMQETVLPHLWAALRTLRIADGPDDVHLGTISKLEARTQLSKL